MKFAIAGGGLAGCECAWQLARRGHQVTIFEMKPERYSPAHDGPGLAELVCSNSFRSEDAASAIGQLKAEMTAAGSLIMEAAQATRVPAGKALAVDRENFSAKVTAAVEGHENIIVRRRHVESLDDACLQGFDRVVVAAGPLASDPLAESLRDAISGTGGGELYFYDAIAPIVTADSVDMNRAFLGSRYAPEDDSYLNCPLTEDEYKIFVAALLSARAVPCRDFEKEVHFEGCLPLEAMAERGEMTLAFGPLKPVGLVDPKTGQQPFAVLQLRPENAARTLYNLVGCQTKLAHPEQKRVFGLIPALATAEYERLGSIHRNTFVNAPKVLTGTLELRSRPGVHLAGQITGVEGYLESAACGLWLGMHLGGGAGHPPPESAMGGLLGHLRTPAKNFQPMNVTFGLTPPLNRRAPKRKRKELYAQRAQAAFGDWLNSLELPA